MNMLLVEMRKSGVVVLGSWSHVLPARHKFRNLRCRLTDVFTCLEWRKSTSNNPSLCTNCSPTLDGSEPTMFNFTRSSKDLVLHECEPIQQQRLPGLESQAEFVQPQEVEDGPATAPSTATAPSSQFEGLKLIPSPPNLDEWRAKLFDVDDTIALTEEEYVFFYIWVAMPR